MQKNNNVGPCGGIKAVQIHPSRFCNLNCKHCYSSSSPWERDKLDVTLLSAALADAVEEGYDYVSISGGEPLLYPSLTRLLIAAKTNGLMTAITTNGMLLNKRRITQLAGNIDLIAISLDGIPESHNWIRNSSHAFEKMAENLQYLGKSEIPFGFIFTLTQYNLNELEWVIEFALEQGASLLQIHPLEIAGAATEKLKDDQPDRTEAAYAYLYINSMMQKFQDKLTIQLDYANRTVIKENPDLIYARTHDVDIKADLSDSLAEITIEPDGMVVPIQYGFSRRYALGDLHKLSFKQMAREWKENRMTDFFRLCDQVYRDMIDDSNAFIFNWNEIITLASNQPLTKTTPFFKENSSEMARCHE